MRFFDSRVMNHCSDATEIKIYLFIHGGDEQPTRTLFMIQGVYPVVITYFIPPIMTLLVLLADNNVLLVMLLCVRCMFHGCCDDCIDNGGTLISMM